MYRFIPPVVVLAPHDSNVVLYAQVCWLFCVFFMPLFGLAQARPWFRSSMWISSVAGISSSLCMFVVATNATHTCERILDILRLGTSFSWCVPLLRIENAGFLLAITASQWRNVLFDPCVLEARPSYFAFLWRHFFLDFCALDGWSALWSYCD